MTTKFSSFFTFIFMALTLTACGVQDQRGHDDNANPPPSCGEACVPEQDAGDGEPTTDAGQPVADGGSAVPDSGNTEPDPLDNAGKCESAADCVDGFECHDGLCVPAGIIPEPAPEPECTEDADCGEGCWCSNGQCVADGTDPDTAAPAITDIVVSEITATTVTVTWKTDEASVGNHVSYYRFDSDEVQLGFAVTASNGTSHTSTITHLSPSTAYAFFLTSEDAAGNIGESDLHEFATVAMPASSLPDPFRDFGGGQIEFSSFYGNGSGCGEVFGTLPGLSWPDPTKSSSEWKGAYITDGNGDGYMEYSPAAGIADGSYEFSYIDRECTGQSGQRDSLDWANYGSPEMVKLMTAEARAFLFCNWYDATEGHTVPAPDTNGDGLPNPGCEIRITVTNGNVSGRGNMANAQL